MKFPGNLRRKVGLRHLRATAMSLRGSGTLYSFAATSIAAFASAASSARRRNSSFMVPPRKSRKLQATRLIFGWRNPEKISKCTVTAVGRRRTDGAAGFFRVMAPLQSPQVALCSSAPFPAGW